MHRIWLLPYFGERIDHIKAPTRGTDAVKPHDGIVMETREDLKYNQIGKIGHLKYPNWDSTLQGPSK
jgi:hypothetical protein